MLPHKLTSARPAAPAQGQPRHAHRAIAPELHRSARCDPLTEWRRWHAEQEARFAAERARSGREERRLGTRPLSVADVETLIACALAEALELALATERGQDDRSAESVEERELTGMSAFGGGAKSSARSLYYGWA